MKKRCGTMLFYHSNTDEERLTDKLYTDGGSNNFACGYCCCLLAQEDHDVVVKKKACWFHSRKFTKTEMAYAKVEKKLCAMVWSFLAGEMCIGQGISSHD